MGFLHLAFSIVFLAQSGLGSTLAFQQTNYIITAPMFFLVGYLLAAIISIIASVLILKHDRMTHCIAGSLFLFPTCLLGMIIVIDILVIIFWNSNDFGETLPYVFGMYVAAIVAIFLAFIQFWYHVFLTQLLRMKGARWY
ncbi:hypothetical protein LOD99_105 [Oopsacas minuta]|uniref:Uncharacterized protein n=1 Tax=Oopsacas minuta TaxID=111878 RepID=A0AAV7K8F8_9METZ|nr:hypothetical protein LOD99_105 [Oopsacas minuta]